MFKRIIIVILALLIVAVVGLQIFLAYGLTNSMRKWVLPLIKEKYNLDVDIDHVSVNLLAGSLSVHGINIANPPDFIDANIISTKRCELDVGLLTLLKGGITEIEKAAVKDMQFNVILNKKGQLNIAVISENMPQPKATAQAHGAAPATKPGFATTEARKIPDTLIKQMTIQSVFNFINYQVVKDPLIISLKIFLKLKNVANYGNEDVLSGTVELRGKLAMAERESAFDLNGKIGPIIDPTTISCDLTGAIQVIDLKVFGESIERWGITNGTVAGTVRLLCKKGVFVPGKSMLILSFRQLKFTEKEIHGIEGLQPPSRFDIAVPITGTLMNPSVDIGAAILQTLANPDAINYVLSAILDNRDKPPDAGQETKPALKENQKEANKPFEIKSILGEFMKKGGEEKK